ncbi:MAG: insulinase family protein [Clostridia bacterium]|nr:insulinase family protein [Clostridia bacterium]
MALIKDKICEGVNLYYIPADHFKTNRISIRFHLPAERENITKISLLTQVLKRGTEKYKDMKEISEKCDDLYGASVGAGTSRMGDRIMVGISESMVADRFLSERILPEAIDVLKQVVFFPYLENGSFKKEYVEQEKENLRTYINGIINDKKSYANLRCNQIMFEGDPFGISSCGYIEDIDGITPENLYEEYQRIISECSADIFISGSYSKEDIELVKKEFGFMKPRKAEDIPTVLAKPEDIKTEKRVTEEMQVTQSKLAMGFRIGVDPIGEEIYALTVFNCLFGGSPFSKLFMNVREKMSLAYYVYSSLDRMKSIMQISSGIEAENYEKALEGIFGQLEEVKKGNFTEEDLEASKRYIATSFNASKDSLVALERNYIRQLVCGKEEEIEEFLDNINKVRKEDVCAVAHKIKLDTIYFLKGEGK